MLGTSNEVSEDELPPMASFLDEKSGKFSEAASNAGSIKKKRKLSQRSIFDLMNKEVVEGKNDEEETINDELLTAEEVNIVKTKIPNIIMSCIQEDYARLMFPALSWPRGSSHRPVHTKIFYYHGYQYKFMFGALLNTIEVLFRQVKAKRITGSDITTALENILWYWLAARTACYQDKVSPLAGTSSIREAVGLFNPKYDCCTQAFYKKRRDKESVVLDHLIQHYHHEPTRKEYKRAKNIHYPPDLTETYM